MILVMVALLFNACIALHDCSVLDMVSLLFLELYQLLQYSYDCSSVMSVHPEVGAPRGTLEYPLLV